MTVGDANTPRPRLFKKYLPSFPNVKNAILAGDKRKGLSEGIGPKLQFEILYDWIAN